MVILRLLSFSLGLSLICYVLFSYEDEEKTLRNWFDTAWSALADSEKEISGRTILFLRGLLVGLNRLLSRIYGSKFVSIRAFLTSAFLCTCMASVALIYMLSEIPIPPGNTPSNVANVATTMLPPLAISSIVDFVGVAAVRRFFQAAARSPSLLRTFLLIAVGTTVTPVLILVVYVGLLVLSYLLVSLQGTWSGAFILTLFLANVAVGGLWKSVVINLLALATAASFLAILVTVVVGRILYAVAPRVLYSVIKLKIMENRKIASGLGVLLIGFAIPSVVPSLGGIVKALFG